jgi:hypothetical protein
MPRWIDRDGQRRKPGSDGQRRMLRAEPDEQKNSLPVGSIAVQATDENRDASARPLPMDEGSRRWVRVAKSTKMRDIQKQCLRGKLIPWLTWHIQIWCVIIFLASMLEMLRF